MQILVPVLESQRISQFIPIGAHLKRHELETGERLGNVGLHVHWWETDYTRGVKNPDATINGEIWEFKSPTGSGASTISNQLHRAKAQRARRIVIDMARTSLDDADVLAELGRRFAQNDWWLSVIHIDHDGTVTQLNRST